MKKTVLYIILFLFILFLGYFSKEVFAIPNPWIDCNDDISCAAKKAGFNFPLRVQNYSVRAMDDMIEIKFNLDKKRTITVRKSKLYHLGTGANGDVDLSGVYENYPVNKTITLKNGVLFNVRGEKNKFYIANFSAETGYYSIYSKKGLKLKDLNNLYNIIEEAEAIRFNEQETNSYTIEQLQDLRRVDGIVEPVYTQACFPRTLLKKGVTKDCFVRANFGQDSFCSASQIKMIKEYYKKGQDKDPISPADCQFCAD